MAALGVGLVPVGGALSLRGGGGALCCGGGEHGVGGGQQSGVD